MPEGIVGWELLFAKFALVQFFKAFEYLPACRLGVFRTAEAKFIPELLHESPPGDDAVHSFRDLSHAAIN